MSTSNKWWLIKNANKIDTPALAIYPQRVEKNILNALSIQPNVALLRPHVKTNKIPEVQQMLMKHGVTKFKCSTIAEAEMLAAVNAPDVLLAYQPTGPRIQRFLALVQAYPKTAFSCIIDNSKIATELSKGFRKIQGVAQVFIDVNNGMNRTGIVPAKILALYSDCLKLKGIAIRGLHVYDGHITATSVRERAREVRSAFSEVDAIFEVLNDHGKGNLVMVAGGTPSFPIHAQRKNVECSPGTFVFWDWGYGKLYHEMPFEPAALVLTRVLSVLDANHLCLDLGYKAVAAEKPMPRVKFLNEPRAVSLAQSEEHLVVKVSNANRYSPGDLWYGLPIHICPTVALYDKALLVEKGILTGEWQIVARTRKIFV
jgi:D-serine deaminase-like pyridoxal phosphate-dependent protein